MQSQEVHVTEEEEGKKKGGQRVKKVKHADVFKNGVFTEYEQAKTHRTVLYTGVFNTLCITAIGWAQWRDLIG